MSTPPSWRPGGTPPGCRLCAELNTTPEMDSPGELVHSTHQEIFLRRYHPLHSAIVLQTMIQDDDTKKTHVVYL